MAALTSAGVQHLRPVADAARASVVPDPPAGEPLDGRAISGFRRGSPDPAAGPGAGPPGV
jgi:hypothetical protein